MMDASSPTWMPDHLHGWARTSSHITHWLPAGLPPTRKYIVQHGKSRHVFTDVARLSFNDLMDAVQNHWALLKATEYQVLGAELAMAYCRLPTCVLCQNRLDASGRGAQGCLAACTVQHRMANSGTELRCGTLRALLQVFHQDLPLTEVCPPKRCMCALGGGQRVSMLIKHLETAIVCSIVCFICLQGLWCQLLDSTPVHAPIAVRYGLW
jgi:hypothetical protein